MNSFKFKEKQFDGPYEVTEVEINNEGQIFRCILYYPSENFKKPYDLIIYFHGFPQLFPLIEIVKSYNYLLEMGYSFFSFDFRGYRLSEGTVSIVSQVSDAFKVIEFVKVIGSKNLLDLNNVNIIAHDFGAYIALILCSRIEFINRLLLLSPILDLQRHVENTNFKKALHYVNRFLPGNIKGIENVDKFIKKVKDELSHELYQIDLAINKLKYNKLKLIIGEVDKITPISEVSSIFHEGSLKNFEIRIIENMDHDCIEETDFHKINEEIIQFFKK